MPVFADFYMPFFARFLHFFLSVYVYYFFVWAASYDGLMPPLAACHCSNIHMHYQCYVGLYLANKLSLLYLSICIANSPHSVGCSLFALNKLKTLLFCKSFPLQPFFFFFSTDYMIPQTFTGTSEHIRSLLFSFSALHFLVVGSVR